MKIVPLIKGLQPNVLHSRGVLNGIATWDAGFFDQGALVWGCLILEDDNTVKGSRRFFTHVVNLTSLDALRISHYGP